MLGFRGVVEINTSPLNSNKPPLGTKTLGYRGGDEFATQILKPTLNTPLLRSLSYVFDLLKLPCVPFLMKSRAIYTYLNKKNDYLNKKNEYLRH